MIKTLFKVIITILFIVSSVYFFKKISDDNLWGNSTPLIFESDQDAETAVSLLSEFGFKDILYKNNITIGINDYFDFDERSLVDIDNTLDRRDYRYDPFIDSTNTLFSSRNADDSIVYIVIDSFDLLSLYNIHKILTDNAILYNHGNPIFLRIVLNFFSFIFMLLLFGLGCKKRFLITLVTGVLAFFFMELSSLNSYLCFSLSYFLLIMLLESISFSNRYIKRNNIGILRILLFIVIFSIPTFLPSFIDYSKEINTPISLSGDDFSYVSLSEGFDDGIPNISNYFAHYTYQKSYMYGTKYSFPSHEKSVTIMEFKRVDYYLSNKERVVLNYDEDFFQDFLTYCSSTALGRFYLDYKKPFKLEYNSLLSLYIKEKEYMQIAILAVTMLISSLFFKKNRDKKIKY